MANLTPRNIGTRSGVAFYEVLRRESVKRERWRKKDTQFVQRELDIKLNLQNTGHNARYTGIEGRRSRSKGPKRVNNFIQESEAKANRPQQPMQWKCRGAVVPYTMRRCSSTTLARFTFYCGFPYRGLYLYSVHGKSKCRWTGSPAEGKILKKTLPQRVPHEEKISVTITVVSPTEDCICVNNTVLCSVRLH